jgi:hypothetical protein
MLTAMDTGSSGPLDAASTRERNWPGHGGVEIGDGRGRHLIFKFELTALKHGQAPHPEAAR